MNLLRGAIVESSRVTFPGGAVTGESKVLDVAMLVGGKIALLLEETPFHPVDATWPDQPADRGMIQLKGGERTFPVEDCQIFGVHKETKDLAEMAKVPGKEKQNWFAVVAHIINPQELEAGSFLEETVVANVDAVYRNALNTHHTGCHMAAAALNQATHSYWSKGGARQDSLKAWDLDHEAMDTSMIFENRSEDLYRFGKSIKKKGLQTEQLFSDLEKVQQAANDFLAQWVASGAPVAIQAAGPHLDDTRTWHCNLPDGREVKMFCGGSHLPSLSKIAAIQYNLEPLTVDGEKKLKATTVVTLKSE
ncbi:MAG: metal-dependent hydrolase [Verrucomicrobiota bacterium]|nr:metal-dependent hydrolase [Verrucomicrobiota bacterium]